MRWKFQPRHPGGGKNRNPLGDEFFTDAELLTDASSLVREAIQNSLDAQEDPEKTLRVRFKIGSKNFESTQASPFSGLEPHTLSTLGESAGKISLECRYLVYEDFNTTGLLGDSRLDVAGSSKPKKDQSYTYFVHYEGEGSKDDGSRGKWGVGKVVFPKISKIKSHFNYSVRASEDAPCGKTNVLIGQSILKFHELDGINYHPDGWLAESTDGVPLPFSGTQAHDFATSWSIKRKLDEKGLSIVVPYIADDLQIAQFRDAVIRQYFLSIVGGELECQLEDESGHEMILQSDNILEFIESLGVLTDGSSRDLSAEQVKTAMVAFVTAVSDCEPVSIEVPDNLTPPTSLQISESAIGKALESLDNHGVAWFTVSVKVPVQNTTKTVEDVFEVLVTRIEGDHPIIYSREQILVPGTRAINVSGHIAIVLTSRGPLADLLGRAEGPAHEDWRDDTQRFKSDYDSPKESRVRASRLLKVVRQFPKKIVQELSKRENVETDTQFFADWFAPPKPEGIKPASIDAGGKLDPAPPVRGKLKPSPSFSVSSGVLKVTSGKTRYKPGSTINLELAYSVSRGNAFKKWDKSDFTLGDESDLSFSIQGAEILLRTENTLSIKVVVADDWRLAISGFRRYRDLEVHSEVLDKGSK